MNKTFLKKSYSTENYETKKNIHIAKNTLELTEKSFDDDTVVDEINLGEVLMETISLEIPDYPKRSGASLRLTPTSSTSPVNPFSILRKLKK